jgi:hypothetical protein
MEMRLLRQRGRGSGGIEATVVGDGEEEEVAVSNQQ